MDGGCRCGPSTEGASQPVLGTCSLNYGSDYVYLFLLVLYLFMLQIDLTITCVFLSSYKPNIPWKAFQLKKCFFF